MSILPLLLSAWLTEMDRPARMMEQPFGLDLMPNFMDRLTLRDRAMFDLYFKPMTFGEIFRRGDVDSLTISKDKDNFKVILDVKQFKPEEISVKLVGQFVVVEAKHEEKRDEHGLISRQFVRKYLLPELADTDKLTSNISTDGILTITTPLKQIEESAVGRTIEIQLTGKPAFRRGEVPITQKPTGEQSGEELTTEGQQQQPETQTPEK